MRLSKVGYYADFIVYPPVVSALTAAGLWSSRSDFFAYFVSSCVLGVVGWTFVEYVMHRFVFHRIEAAIEMHDMHHAAPTAFVGTPTWVSLAGFLFGAFLPLWWAGGLEIAYGGTVGLMIGYLGYLTVHDAVHRWRIDDKSILYRAKLRHAAHHYGEQDGNFGVTTGFWDRMFGTALGDSRGMRNLRA
jgi:sterol desaturase/sphingolipid hydroxylase (fatty acid hydroxylase superfamily)